MKKSAICAIAAVTLCLFTACSNDSAGGGVGNKGKAEKPVISISNEKEDGKTDTTVAPAVEAKKVSILKEDVLKLLGKQKKEILDLVTSGGAKVEEKKDEIHITTENDEQRRKAVDAIYSYIKQQTGNITKADDCTINFDVEHGNIDVYCLPEHIDDVSKCIDKTAGAISAGQIVYDNTAAAGVVVTVYNSKTGITVAKSLVSDKKGLSIPSDSWVNSLVK